MNDDAAPQSAAASSTAPADAVARLRREQRIERFGQLRLGARVLGLSAVGASILVASLVVAGITALFIGPEIAFTVQQARIPHVPFDREAWRNTKELPLRERERARLAMRRDLERALTPGTAKESVVAMLGPSEFRDAFGDHTLAYWLAHPSKCGFDSYWLVIAFSNEERLERVTGECD